MKPIKTIIPAHPGFYVVEPVTDESNIIIEAALIPIIAWAFIDHNCGEAAASITVSPVTITEIVTEDCPPILEEKTGRVISFVAEFENIAEWINSQNGETKNRVKLDRMLRRKRAELGITTKPKSGGAHGS